MMHFTRKLIKTIRLLCTLFCARIFGQYIHSGWNGDFEYAQYKWRGKEWVIPTGPVDIEHEHANEFIAAQRDWRARYKKAADYAANKF